MNFEIHFLFKNNSKRIKYDLLLKGERKKGKGVRNELNGGLPRYRKAYSQQR
jgi:hypothetical protein